MISGQLGYVGKCAGHVNVGITFLDQELPKHEKQTFNYVRIDAELKINGLPCGCLRFL